MTEMTRRLLLATATAVPFAGWVRIADAAAPKDTAVIAKQIDDIITLDPAECYELSGIEMLTNIYDRLHALRGGGPEQAGRRRRRDLDGQRRTARPSPSRSAPASNSTPATR